NFCRDLLYRADTKNSYARGGEIQHSCTSLPQNRQKLNKSRRVGDAGEGYRVTQMFLFRMVATDSPQSESKHQLAGSGTEDKIDAVPFDCVPKFSRHAWYDAGEPAALRHVT